MRLQSIHVYPVKGLRAVDLEKCRVERRGIAFDRRWMLVDEGGTFLSQRKVAKMATIGITIEGDGLKASHSSCGEISIPASGNGKFRKVQIWRSQVDAIEYDTEIDQWFREALGVPCSLVKMPESTIRPTDPNFSEPGDLVSFADGFPVTIANETSLSELNRHLEESIPMSRFRPNLVISGSASPWEEDRWLTVKLGNLVLRSVKPCGRCLVTTIDQSTGMSNSEEPLTTLAKIRRFGNSLDFSINLIPENEDCIQVGQDIEVLIYQN